MSANPAKTARAIVEASIHYNNPEASPSESYIAGFMLISLALQLLAEISSNLGDVMPGLALSDNMAGGRFAARGA
jgi:pyridoxal biosynthesis lyase PdxS